MSGAWGGATVLQAVDPAQVNTNTLISLGTVLVLIGAAWRLSSVLTKICTEQQQTNEKLAKLEKLPGRIGKVESQVREVRDHIEGLEQDVSILWTTQRGEPLDKVRRKSRRHWMPTAGDESTQEDE